MRACAQKFKAEKYKDGACVKMDYNIKITRFWMEGGKPMFEFSHSTDGSGRSFVPRLKVRGKAELADGWNDVPDGGDASFRFFPIEVTLR